MSPVTLVMFMHEAIEFDQIMNLFWRMILDIRRRGSKNLVHNIGPYEKLERMNFNQLNSVN